MRVCYLMSTTVDWRLPLRVEFVSPPSPLPDLISCVREWASNSHADRAAFRPPKIVTSLELVWWVCYTRFEILC